MFSFFIMAEGGPAYAQIPLQAIQQDPEAVEADVLQPEIPKQIINVEFKNNRLSADLVNAAFGDIIQEISRKAAFSIEGYSSIYTKTITTRFNDLEIDRVIIRLFSLVKEKNYLINYDINGAVFKLEIFGAETGGSVPRTPAIPRVSPAGQQFNPQSPTTSTRPALPEISSPRRISVPQPLQVPQAPRIPQSVTPDQMPEDQDIEHEDLPDENIEEIPYIPPQRRPIYIPPIKR